MRWRASGRARRRASGRARRRASDGGGRGQDRNKDGEKDRDKDRDRTEARTETRTRTRRQGHETGTRTETRTETRRREGRGHGDGINKLLRTDLRWAMALVIYRTPASTQTSKLRHKQTLTPVNSDTGKLCRFIPFRIPAYCSVLPYADPHSCTTGLPKRMASLRLVMPPGPEPVVSLSPTSVVRYGDM